LTYVYGSSGAFSQTTPFGELLIRLSAQGGARLFTLASPSGGAVASFALALPTDVALIGRTAYTQGLILGGGLELCNAIDLTLGY
jgi:hypothetical protein